ncbi:hypothetical protein [Micromonospora parathelypteridis]|uniref:Excreted virulence factor EspC, type VII ESX diderm n=1 Tax=Micromonospora parathelypteridis TaxID=1839617 RepID=A0A840WAA4_9ACTN|nr:hypothetical protein [Micromonospora parathelypteridis]MBB5481039.1 hypothetical protein [Micromonospora parathelypteridis]GGO20376.1 hypothetical protein GCM10011576_37600 [Micromonospora parathelypteridis]
MPTADDYEAAAAVLDTAAQMTATLIEPARAALGAGAMVGGQITGMVTDELDAAAGILDRVSAELTQLAGTCRERAETCRQALAAEDAYDTAYAGYRAELGEWQDNGERGPQPQPPEPLSAAPTWANR